jgi:hypothetical protein
LKTAGTYTSFVQDKNECDSVLVLTLNINVRPVVPILTGINDSIVVSNPEAGVTYQWGYNNNALTVTGSKIRSQGNGTYAVLATNTNSCRTASVLYQWNGIRLRTANFVKVELFPNPATESVSLETDAEIESVQMTNALGQQVEVVRTENRLNLSHLAKGVYRVLIHTNQGSVSKTLVKQ